MSLFQTDAWQSAWWETWGREYGFESVLPWFNGRNGAYLSSYKLKGMLPIRSLEFVGTNYRRVRSVRTEYNTLFSSTNDERCQSESLKKFLIETKWSEAVFSDLLLPSSDVDFLLATANEEDWLVREAKSDSAWSVETSGSFEDYLSNLGRNTRLRLYNRRRVLESLGEVTRDDLWKQGSAELFFDLLNNFHWARWGKPVFGAKALTFHLQFLDRLVVEGGRPLLSVLRCRGDVISVLYNVEYEGRVYNIQSGFEEAFHKKLSLGILHLGYAIEDAFKDPEITVFDMLAGEGKNHNYKKHLATTRQELISLMIVRGSLLKGLYRLKDSRTS